MLARSTLFNVTQENYIFWDQSRRKKIIPWTIPVNKTLSHLATGQLTVPPQTVQRTWYLARWQIAGNVWFEETQRQCLENREASSQTSTSEWKKNFQEEPSTRCKEDAQQTRALSWLTNSGANSGRFVSHQVSQLDCTGYRASKLVSSASELAWVDNNNNNNSSKSIENKAMCVRLPAWSVHGEHTQVYFGVSRFSWSFTLLENMSRALAEAEAGKSHHRSFKFSLCRPETGRRSLVWSLAARLTKIETFFFPTGSLRLMVWVTS